MEVLYFKVWLKSIILRYLDLSKSDNVYITLVRHLCLCSDVTTYLWKGLKIKNGYFQCPLKI